MDKRLNVLVVSKGHDYDRNAFNNMFAAMPDVECTIVEHPAAQVILKPEYVAAYDAVFFYDMSGIPGVGLSHDGADETGLPSADYAASINALLANGVGLILANHATVSWPNWPLWREISGSSFMLSQGDLNGEVLPGSGYRGGHGPLANATIRLQPAATHAVLEGLENGFEITDELYLKTDRYGPDVVPLLRGDYAFTQDNFTPPPLASAQEQASWTHPDGSDLVVWANAVQASPIVVSDVGDGPLAFNNPDFQRLMSNALHWVCSDAAKEWARQLP